MILSLPVLLFSQHLIFYMIHASRSEHYFSFRLWLVGILFQTVSHDSISSSMGNIDLVLQLLSTCHTRCEVETVLASQSIVTSRDLFLAGLQACSPEQGPFFDSHLFYLLHHIDFSLDKVELILSIRCVLDLMTMDQRAAFYWMITILEHTSNLISVCADALSGGTDVELMETFLVYCIHHKSFLFMPALSSSFSLNLSFEEMHRQAGTINGQNQSINLDSYYHIPDTYTEVKVTVDRKSVWNNPWNNVV